MPIWLRKFTFKEIGDFYDEEKKQMEKAQQGKSTTVVDPSGNVNPSNYPQFQNPSKNTTSYK